MEKSKVYFIKEITPENIIKAYDAVGKKLEGNVAVKMHSGEKGNKNYLRPEFVKDVINYVHGTVVECNTAYEGARNSTEKHRELIKEHEWDKYFPFDLLDSEGNDLELNIRNGKVLEKNYVGKNLANYDSMLVLSHFKGHAMGGYGGALKQLSIGCASSAGKNLIHTAGVTKNQLELFDNIPEQDRFLEAMADAAVAEGMPRAQAYAFAAQAVYGSAKMVLETGKHPGELKDMVCSPAGTTIEAVRVLEEKGFRSAVIEAMRACADVSRSL